MAPDLQRKKEEAHSTVQVLKDANSESSTNRRRRFTTFAARDQRLSIDKESTHYPSTGGFCVC